MSVKISTELMTVREFFDKLVLRRQYDVLRQKNVLDAMPRIAETLANIATFKGVNDSDLVDKRKSYALQEKRYKGISRNAYCPCKSGLKFKQCCLV